MRDLDIEDEKELFEKLMAPIGSLNCAHNVTKIVMEEVGKGYKADYH